MPRVSVSFKGLRLTLCLPLTSTCLSTVSSPILREECIDVLANVRNYMENHREDPRAQLFSSHWPNLETRRDWTLTSQLEVMEWQEGQV